MQVLIVGAGPTGLVLAIDLLRRGLEVRVIDKLDRPVLASKGKGLQPRTLEVFEDLGVIDAILASGRTYPLQRFYKGEVVVDERAMTDVRQPTGDVPYPNLFMVPQWKTEEILTQRFEQLGGVVERGVELLDLEQSDRHVRALLKTGGRQTWTETSYVVGADGAHSAVRNRLGIELHGVTPADLPGIVFADVDVAGLDRDYWHFWMHGPADGVALMPLPSTSAFQYMSFAAPGATPDLSIEALQEQVVSRSKRGDLRLSNLQWVSHFRPNIRMAARYRIGRVFLVGDAAHVHPPTGAQGLNTGVQDSYNLGWKLAHVLAGAPEVLLETYEEERLPIAAHVLGLSNTLLLKGLKGGQDGLRRGDDERQLLLNYEGSSLCPPATAASRLGSGDRMPDCVLTDAEGRVERLFDLIHTGAFTVLTNTRAMLDQASVRGALVDVARWGSSVSDVLGVSGTFFCIVRPDGYIGGVFSTPEETVSYLSRFART